MYSLGAKLSVFLCRSTTTIQLEVISGTVVTYLSLSKSYWTQTLVSSPREITAKLHLNLLLGVANERQLSRHHPVVQIWRPLLHRQRRMVVAVKCLLDLVRRCAGLGGHRCTRLGVDQI